MRQFYTWEDVPKQPGARKPQYYEFLSDGNFYDTVVSFTKTKGWSSKANDYWELVVKPIAQAVLPPDRLSQTIRAVTPTPVEFDQLTDAQKHQVYQSVLTQVLNRITKPSSAVKPKPPQKESKGTGIPPEGKTTAGGERQWEEKATPKPEEKPKEPTRWEDLSEDEQQALARAIEENQLQPGEGEGQPFDANSLPENLKQKLREQFKEDAEQMARRLQHALKEWQKQHDAAQRATDVEDEHPEGPTLEELKKLMQQQQQSQQGEGEGEGEGEEEDEAEQEPKDTPSENNDPDGYFDANAPPPPAYGGGGALLDLKMREKTDEERLFQVIQEQFNRLAADPDPSDRQPEGNEVWHPRKLAKAYWKPDLYPVAKQDLVRSPENIYFILDTSGSVSSYAAAIAAMAAGSIGLVHLYHGAEAHPQLKLLRDTPLKSPREFLGFGEDQNEQRSVETPTGNVERQQLVCGPKVPGWQEFYKAHGSSFEANLEWWLLKERPSRGSRIIFWGDTHGVSFRDPPRLAALLRNYQAVWLLPFSVEQMLRESSSYIQHYRNNPQQSGIYEFFKWMDVGLPVVGDCTDAVSLRAALRKIR